MAKAVNVSIRIDEDVKGEQAALRQSGAYPVRRCERFLRQAIHQRGVHFDVRIGTLNQTTIAALEEGKRLFKDPETKRYTAEELLRELNQ